MENCLVLHILGMKSYGDNRSSTDGGTYSLTSSVEIFSDFVSEMNARATQADAQELAGWAIDHLSNVIGFDCAWYGWAKLSAQDIEIYANATLNLPEKYYGDWQDMSEQDLLAMGVLSDPNRVATYDRAGSEQTEGMMALSDGYGLNKLATAMRFNPGQLASFYLSSYRGGKLAKNWSKDERVFLKCAVDQLSIAMELTANEHLPRPHSQTVTIFVNEDGRGILGLQNLKDHLSEHLPNWDGERLPKSLRDIVAKPGYHMLKDLNLMVASQAASGEHSMGLHKLTLRPLTSFDLLTKREQAVAEVLAQGKSHKETARILGVAPSTIRNQTQSIYSKLDVDNRVSLAAHLPG